MKKILGRLLLLCCGLSVAPPVLAASTTSITGLRNTPLQISDDNQTVLITDDGSIEFNAGNAGIAQVTNSSFSNTIIRINTNFSSDGIIATNTDNFSPGSIEISGTGSLTELTIDSGTINSNSSNGAHIFASGTIILNGAENASTTINVGKASGTSGSITNSSTAGNHVIQTISSGLNLTINNNATGTIANLSSSSGQNTIDLQDDSSISTLTLNNAGTISAGNTANNAIYVGSGYHATITNSGSIVGAVNLGGFSDSSITLNGGTVDGDIYTSSQQSVVFNGGNLTAGHIVGGNAIVTFDVDTIFNGEITAATSINLSTDVDLSFTSASSLVTANKINLGTNSSITLNYNQLSTNEVDGTSAYSGRINLNISDSSDIEITTPLGTTNGLAEVRISGNLTDSTAASTILLDTSIKATNTVLEGLESIFGLNNGKSISGNLKIGDSLLAMQDGSSVGGTIQGLTRYAAALVIDENADPATVSSVTLFGEVGGNNKDLISLTLLTNVTLDAATHNVRISANEINLSNLANLTLGSESVVGTIRSYDLITADGFVNDAANFNGNGTVTFTENYTLGGNVGTHTGSALHSVEVGEGIAIDTNGGYEINASLINIGAGSSIAAMGLISGGDNDDSGATLLDTAVTLGAGSSITFSTGGAAFYGSINGGSTSSAVYVNTSLDATNSRFNIGNTNKVGLISILDNSSLDVSGNNGAIKADAITIGDNAILTVGSGEIVGTVDGLSANDQGTFNVQGNLQLDGVVGGTHLLKLLNIGNTGQAGPEVVANESVSATSITLNGTGTQLFIADGKTLNGAVTLSEDNLLLLESGEFFGSVDGDENNHGFFKVWGNNSIDGAIGANNSLATVDIGAADKTAEVSAGAISATSITINGDGSALSIAANSAVVGDVSFAHSNTKLNLGDGSQVTGQIRAATTQYSGELNIVAGANVVSNGDIGAFDAINNLALDLAAVKINNNATLNLNTNHNSLNAQAISLIDNATLIFGSASVVGDILGYNSNIVGSSAHGAGKGNVTFADDNTIAGNIGNNSGNAVNLITVKNGKTVHAGNASIYAASFTLESGSSLDFSGAIGGGDNADANAQIGTSITLGSGATLTLNTDASLFGQVNGSAAETGILEIGTGSNITSNITVGNIFKLAAVNISDFATFDLSANNNSVKALAINMGDDSVLTFGSGAVNGTIDGSAANQGTINIADSHSFGTEVTFGSTNGLLAVNFGNVAGADFDSGSIKAATVKVIGSGSHLNLADNAAITGNVVLDGDSVITLGDGSAVNGTITNLSNSTSDGSVIIREDATVATNGNIGGGGFNFAGVLLQAASNLDLSAHNNTITASLIQISEDATLTIGTGTVDGGIQSNNSLGGNNYGLGKVVFAGDNTLGGNVGQSNGASLESITINEGITVTGDSHRMNASSIILKDNAVLNSTTDLISGGTAQEGGSLTRATITLGDDAVLSLSGTSLLATVDGASKVGDLPDNHRGVLTVSNGTVSAYGNIGNNHALAQVNITDNSTLDLSSSNVVLKAQNVYMGDGSTLTIGTSSVTGDIVGHAAVGSGNGLGNVVFVGANNSLAGKLGGHNDNALGNVTINNANSVAAGSHEINATTITLDSYATLTTSGAISGGADVTGATPIATAISLQANALLTFNAGSSVFGTIDAAEAAVDGLGSIEFAANFTTNGNIGATFKLASVYVNDGVSLDLGTNSNSLNAKTVYIGTDSELSLGTGGTVNAAIASLTADTGVLYINESTTIDAGATLGGDTGLLSLYIDHAANGGVVVDSSDSIKARNVNIEGADSALNLASEKSITGNVNIGEDSILSLADGSYVVGTIDGIADSQGVLEISGDVSSHGNIGNSHRIALITIDNTSSLDVSANDNSVSATSILLASTASLKTGTATLNSAIDGSANNRGTLNIDASKTTTTNGDIGASHFLTAINIDSGATLDAATNSNAIKATNINFASGAILNIGSGEIYGNFIGTTSGDGTINFNSNKNLGNDVSLGNTDNALNTVAIKNGVALQTTNAIYASHINVGTTGLAASSLYMEAADGTTLGGDFTLTALATLEINSSGVVTIGAVQGSVDDVGTLRLSGGGITTLSDDIGTTHALSKLYVDDFQSLNAFTNSASIAAQDIYLAAGAGIIVGSGALSGTVHGAGDSDSVSFASVTAYSLSGDLGVASDTHAIDTVSLAGSLSNGSHGIRANNFVFDSNDAVLNIGSGAVAIGAFANNHAGSGTISFAESNSMNFEISADNEIFQLLVANGATANINEDVSTNTARIGAGTSGKLILASGKTISGDVTIVTGANLTLQGTAAIAGNIFGTSSSGSGTLELATSASVAAAGNIGSSVRKLSAITINNNASLNLGAHNLVASNVSLGSGSTLTIGSGTFSALVSGSSSGGSGNGTINFASDRTLAQNIGTSSNKVATVGVAANQTLQSGANAIYSNNISLANGAAFELQNGAFVSNQINGDSAGHGNINASGTATLNAIGGDHAVNNITTAANSNITFGGNINAAGDVNINGTAIFSNATTNITANSFNINSGATLSLSLNLSSPATSLEIVGGAIISANTQLNLTISGSAASGTSFTLINASAASTIATISGAQINVNNSGSNVVSGQTYATAVSGNRLVLTLTGEAAAPTLTFPSNNTQNAYNAIIGASNPTGALSVVQDYLSGAASIAQKEEVIKSVTTQTDNAANRVDFNNITTTANIISARLESLYNDVNIMNSGPSFALNNNGTNSQAAWAQTLEPLRDNNTKPAYPVSLALNDPQEKGSQAAWIQTFGSNINQKTTNDGDGYKANSGGVSVGFDCKKCADFIVGASASYAQSSVRHKGSAKNLNIDSYQVSVYTGHSTKSYFLNTSLGLALNNYNSTRQIAIAGTSAKAAYSGNSYTARVELGSNYKFENETILTPSVTLTAARNTYDSYNESGAGTLNLHVKNDSSNFFEGRVGAELSRLFLTKNDSKVRPQFSLSYGYDFIGDEQRTNSNFIGQTTSFTSEGAKVAQGSLKIGTGVALYTKDDITLGVNYSFEHRESYTSNSGWMRVRYGF